MHIREASKEKGGLEQQMDPDKVENGHVPDSAEGSLTTSVLIICVIAASAGLMFGYDIGVSGKLFFFPLSLTYKHENLYGIRYNGYINTSILTLDFCHFFDHRTVYSRCSCAFLIWRYLYVCEL